MKGHFHSHADTDIFRVAFHDVGEHAYSLFKFHQGQNIGAGIKAQCSVLVGYSLGPDGAPSVGGEPLDLT